MSLGAAELLVLTALLARAPMAVNAAATTKTPGALKTPACLPATVTAGPGVEDPFKAPVANATVLNTAGRVAYRQGHWEQARAQYRAALAADPDFWAPRLNIACSFVRQERFAEATAEILQLLQGPFIPWARQIREATDLGALKVRPEMATVEQAMADAARRWGSGLTDDLVFVARVRPALRIPATEEGVFILGPQQEAFAWSPVTGRYRQLTAEDGRVLAIARSPDRRRLLYVTAEKLIRAGAGKEAYRGLALRVLDLPAMSLGPAIPLEGDVTRLELAGQPRAFAIRVEGDKTSGWFSLEPHLPRLMPRAGPARVDRKAAASAVVLTPRGVIAPHQDKLRGDCPLVARERSASAPAPAEGEGAVTAIEIAGEGRKPFVLKSRLGAGLAGLASP